MKQIFYDIRKFATQFLVEILLVLNYPEKAIALVKRSLKLMPDDPYLERTLLKIYKVTYDWEEICSLFNTIEESEPNNAIIKFNFGSLLFVFCRYEEAIPYYEFCVHNWPQNDDIYLANAFARLGICYTYLGQWKNAEDTLQKANEMNFRDLDAFYGMFLLYKGTCRGNLIPEYLDKKIEETSFLYPLYYWKANYIHHLSYKPEEALKWYQMAVTRYNFIVDKNFRFYLCRKFSVTFHYIIKNYIDALIECGYKEKAWWVAHWYSMKDLGPENDRTLTLVYYYIQTGELTRAEKLIRRKCRNKIDPDCWAMLALVQKIQGKLEEALNTINDAIRLIPFDPIYWDILGSIQMEKKDWKAATKTYEEVTRMEPFSSDWLEKLGRCFLETGNLPQARVTYERILILDPLDASARVELENISSQLSQ
jgi:tetratricopeptide (TPR) repeat protein